MPLAFAHDDQTSVDRFDRSACSREQHHYYTYASRKMSDRLSALHLSTAVVTRSRLAKIGVLSTGATDKDYFVAGRRSTRTKTTPDRGTLDPDIRLDTVIENTIFPRAHRMEYPNDEKTRKDA